MKCVKVKDLIDINFDKHIPTDVLTYNIPIYKEYNIDKGKMEIVGVDLENNPDNEVSKVCIYKWKDVFDEVFRLGANVYKNNLSKKQDKDFKRLDIFFSWVKKNGFLFIPKKVNIISNNEMQIICEVTEKIYMIQITLEYLRDVHPREKIDNSFDIYSILNKIGIVDNNVTITSEEYINKLLKFIQEYENKYQDYLKCFYDTDIYYSSTGTFRFITYSTSFIAIAWKKMKLQISSLKIFSDDESKYVDVRICENCLQAFCAISPRQLRCDKCQINEYGYDIKDVKNYDKLINNQHLLKSMWFGCINQDKMPAEISERIEYLIRLDKRTLKENSNVSELEELQKKLY